MISILIVDDEHLIRKALKETIKNISEDFQVVGDAGDGFAALEMIDHNRPDLVFLDIRMPEMSGLELAARIKDESPSTLLVFLTGYADFAYARQALVLGALDYILKPVRKDNLEEVLNRARRHIYEENENIVDRDIRIESDGTLFISRRVIEKYGLKIAERQKCRQLTVQAIKYIIDNFSHDLKLHHVSNMVHVSKNYFCTTFKADTSLSFPQFINIYRLEKAEQFLKVHPELKLYELADMVGFNDPKYFTQVFKKMTGKSISTLKDT